MRRGRRCLLQSDLPNERRRSKRLRDLQARASMDEPRLGTGSLSSRIGTGKTRLGLGIRVSTWLFGRHRRLRAGDMPNVQNCGSVAEAWESAKLGWRTPFG